MSYVLKRFVQYKPHSTGITFTFPALFSDSGLLISHLRFLYSKRSKSPSWLERNTFAVELLLQFIDRQQFNFSSATEMLRAFVEALQFGTIHDGRDDSGLFWSPRRNEDVNVLLHHITSYCDYIDIIHGVDLPQLNPMRKATYAEERLRWCAYYRRSSNCFLNHLDNSSNNDFSISRQVYGPQRHFVDVEEVYRFPEEDIERLINDGFTSRSGKVDYGSQLIVMLMHYGGLRLSECFQIYTEDISIDTKTFEALISVFHPSDGKAPIAGFTTRREFLATKHRLKPRNEYPRNHRLYSGWKNPALTNQNLSFNVMFCPEDKAIEFTSILQKYLSSESRRKSSSPFLFVNLSGNPESKKSLIQKHKRAVNRIGLQSSKFLGTTPHGHRHSYGYRLGQKGFSQLEIQKAMHHKSPDSCLVYLRPTNDEVRQVMREKL